MTKKQKFIIVDGNALFHRAWHAIPELTTKKGELVNAIYGFVSILLNVLKNIDPEYAVVTFDRKAKTFRHQEFKEYKAQRVKPPKEMYDQLPRLKEVIEAFNIPIFEKDGYEADDLIGTLVREKSVDNDQILSIIVTGDLDTLQLVDGNTHVFTMKKGINDTITYDLKAIKDRYGLTPEELIDYKALRGDPSDNIPGVRGVGEKTAIQLIQKYGSLEKLYKKLDQDDEIKPRIKKLLEEHKEDAFLSKKLVTIICDVPIKFNLEASKLSDFDKNEVAQIFRELEFNSLINRLNEIKSDHDSSPTGSRDIQSKSGEDYYLIDNQKKFNQFFGELKKQKIFAIDTETTSADVWNCQLLGISFSWKKGQAYYLPIQEAWLNKIKPILESSGIKKVGHNIKFDLEALKSVEIDMQGIIFDTLLAAYLLNPGTRGYSLDKLIFGEFGYQMQGLGELLGQGKDKIEVKDIPLKKLAWYAAEDADFTWRLYPNLKADLKENNLYSLAQKIEFPLIEVLGEMEGKGVKIDHKFLRQMSKEVGQRIKEIEKETYKLAGVEFNLASPKQLKEILFEKLNISTAGLGKTKTGVSTAAKELDKLKGRHEIIDLIIEHRELSKLKSTYLDTLPELINKKSGRVHTNFNQFITATGRLSSSNPNLQNIPIKTELGRQVRKAFVAEQSNKILSLDYSQIELRIAAHLANDPKMIEAFKKGEDIHTRTAAEINGVELKDVTKEMRYRAKEVNFGVIYGMGAFGLASRTGISREEARFFIEKYFTLYQGVHTYLQDTIAEAHDLEYLETLFGRRRYFNEINSPNKQLASQAERMAVNHPIQGTAADLMKLAMIQVHDWISKEFKDDAIKMVLQVHDELVFEVKKDLVKKVAKEIKKIMSKAHKLNVPIEVDASVGDNWGELEKLKI